MLPIVTRFSGHDQHVAGFEKDVSRLGRFNASHCHDARRSKTDRKDCFTEGGPAVDVEGNSLPGKVLVDDQLIEICAYKSLLAEVFHQFKRPFWKRADVGVGIETSAAIVVSISILLDSALKVILPRQVVNGFQQLDLSCRSDMAAKVVQPRDGRLLHREFEKHVASISLG